MSFSIEKCHFIKTEIPQEHADFNQILLLKISKWSLSRMLKCILKFKNHMPKVKTETTLKLKIKQNTNWAEAKFSRVLFHRKCWNFGFSFWFRKKCFSEMSDSCSYMDHVNESGYEQTGWCHWTYHVSSLLQQHPGFMHSPSHARR